MKYMISTKKSSKSYLGENRRSIESLKSTWYRTDEINIKLMESSITVFYIRDLIPIFLDR